MRLSYCLRSDGALSGVSNELAAEFYKRVTANAEWKVLPFVNCGAGCTAFAST
jgi:hypothetical protein